MDIISNEPGSPSPDVMHLRPSERVMEFLLAEVNRPDRKQSWKLPTMRQMAARLDVSQPTVHTVMQKLVKQGRIRTVAGSGTYLVPPRVKRSDVVRIAINAATPEGDTGLYWIHRVAAAITLAVCRSDRRIHFAPLPQHITDEAAEVRNLLEERALVDALILFPLEDSEPVRTAYESAGKPVVEINPPDDTATSNFVSADFYGSSLRLGKAWAAAGRTRIVCLTSFYDGAASERLRFAGLSAGFGKSTAAGVSLRVMDVSSSAADVAQQAIRSMFADKTAAPDAIYCCGDYQALGVLRACQDAGLRVPEDVSIVGGSGLDLSETQCPQLTRVRQPFEKLGQELISMVCQRIDQKTSALPARIVPTEFMGGATTRAIENSVLGIPAVPLNFEQ